MALMPVKQANHFTFCVDKDFSDLLVKESQGKIQQLLREVFALSFHIIFSDG